MRDGYLSHIRSTAPGPEEQVLSGMDAPHMVGLTPYTASDVRDAVESLPRPYRTLVYSMFYERVGAAETAHRLGIARRSVYRASERALAELRYRLANAPLYEERDAVLTMLLSSAKYSVEDGRPVIWIRLLNSKNEWWPEFSETSPNTQRARGAVECIRVLDRTLFHPTAPPVTHPEPILLREFAESRLLRGRSGLTAFERSIVERLHQ